MTTASTPMIDNAEEVAHKWIDELGDYLNWSNDAQIQRLLRTVLHTIRDFLTVDEAADVAAQLPVLIRGIYYENWNPSATPCKPRNKAAFMARIAEAFRNNPIEDQEAAVAAVIKLLSRHVSAGEMSQVRQAMRKDLKFLFPDMDA